MTKIKICGITNLEDARLAVELGADLLGFNFYTRSPRYVEPAAAKAILSELPTSIECVGVFVNGELDQIMQDLNESGIGCAQLHGDETPEFVASLAKFGPDVIKAFRIGTELDAENVAAHNVERSLLDSLSTRGYGGTGESFDWKIAIEFKQIHPAFFLAGGLTPENVAEAIRKIQPYGVDVCSGVESSKGKKDKERLARFIANARSAI